MAAGFPRGPGSARVSPQPTRILIVGGGGREHALAWKLAAEPGVNEVIVAPGSAAIAGEPRVRTAPDADPLDVAGLARLARAHAVELAVIGPEASLAAGAADALRAAGVPTFGPSRAAARIETSKAFCRQIAASAGVRMAEGAAFDDPDRAVAFAQRLAADRHGVVVKADGLAAGKGVIVCEDDDEAADAIRSLLDGSGVARLVVEARLVGREASLVALTDGRDVLALPAARDHKRLRDGDHGPNTGGMGAYSPLPDLPDRLAEELLARFHRPILAELGRRGTPFRGALYAGLMLTADGPVLLECNARFGDPETQVVLPRIAVALGPLLLAAAQGDLLAAAHPLGLRGGLLPVAPQATVGLVLAAAGYPGTPRTGDAIMGLAGAAESGGLVFHSGTAASGDGFVTRGGRVLTVVARGADLAAARRHAESAADRIGWDGLQRRHDIGPAADAQPELVPA